MTKTHPPLYHYNKISGGINKTTLIISVIASMILLILTDRYLSSDYICSVLIVTIYLINFISIWIIGNRKLEPIILFYMTFGLFILGRFFACILGLTLPIWNTTFYFDYIINNHRKAEILRFVVLFLISVNIGYYISRIGKPIKFADISLNYRTTNKTLNICFWILLLISLYYNSHQLKSVIEGGYLSLYQTGQNSEYTGSSTTTIISSVLFGVAYGYGNQNNKIKYLLLYYLNGFISIIMGSRSGLGCILLFTLWLYSQYRKISLLKIIAIAISSMLLLLFIFQFSIRAINSNFGNTDIHNLIRLFLYDQGISLIVFDTSRLINDYPIIPYIQAFIPGTSAIYSFLAKEQLFPWDVSFAAYMCHYLNPEYYAKGWGLGWTAMSDLYLLSFRTLPIFIILTTSFSYFIGCLETNLNSSKFAKAILYTIILQLLMFPRGGLNQFMPMIGYLIVTLLTIQLLSRYRTKFI